MKEEEKRAQIIMQLVSLSEEKGQLENWATKWLDKINAAETDAEREQAWTDLHYEVGAVMREIQDFVAKFSELIQSQVGSLVDAWGPKGSPTTKRFDVSDSE